MQSVATAKQHVSRVRLLLQLDILSNDDINISHHNCTRQPDRSRTGRGLADKRQPFTASTSCSTRPTRTSPMLHNSRQPAAAIISAWHPFHAWTAVWHRLCCTWIDTLDIRFFCGSSLNARGGRVNVLVIIAMYHHAHLSTTTIHRRSGWTTSNHETRLLREE
jgi:hypothetical protein